MELIANKNGWYTYIYHWENGALEELDVKDPSGALEEGVYLVQDQETGQYGVYVRGATDITSHNYYFLDHREIVNDTFDGGRYRWMLENGEATYEEYKSNMPEFTYNQQGITEAQYNHYLNQFNQRYLLGDTLYKGGGDYDTVPIEDVFSALAALFHGETVSDQILGEFTQRETTAEPEFDNSYFADLIPKATQYAVDWYLDPAYVDTNDTVTGKLRGFDWPCDAVTASGITTMEDLRQQSHQYFTYSEISALEGDYVEQDGKLYLPRADGLGGESYIKIYVDSEKVSDTQYEVIVCGMNYDGTITRETVNYVLEDGQWVFDTFLLSAFGAEGYAIELP
jgi:hypothetical protein